MNKMAPASKRLLFYPHLRELLRWEHIWSAYIHHGYKYICSVYNDPRRHGRQTFNFVCVAHKVLLGDQQARKLRINETNTYACAGMQITCADPIDIFLFHPKRSL
jgi:hypothetical protein